MQSLLQLLRFLAPHRLRLIAATSALVFTALSQLTLGYGIQVLIDEGIGGQSEADLRRAVTLLVTIASAMALGTFIRFYLVSWLGERVSADLRSRVFENLVRLHPAYFETNQAGEIMSRLTTDTTLLQTLIGSSVSLAARNALTLVGALVMMLVTNLKLSMMMLVVVPITLAPLLIFGRRVRKLSNRSQESIAHVGSRAGEILQSIKVVQSYNREDMERVRFDEEVETAFTIARSRIRQTATLMGVAIFMLSIGLVGMLWTGGQDVIAGRMSGGELGAFIFYAIMVGSAFATLSEVWNGLQRAAGAAERLLDLMTTRSAVLDDGEVMPLHHQTITFREVAFAYPSRPDQLALEDFNLTIQRGQSLALVGPSGAGKSTVFELLQRFHEPSQGAIVYGDTPLKMIPLFKLRERYALVPQSPVLFSANVRFNIAYGRPNASDEEIEQAARAAHCHEFISDLAEGYHTPLGAQGVQLSGGQRQRIALARAILNDPEILLLDEATSALDTESEYLVQQALAQIKQGRTTIIIAHRLSTILNADQIAVMEAGRVVATGTHRELLEKSPLYKRLAELQFSESTKPLERSRS